MRLRVGPISKEYELKEPHLILGIGELLWDMLPEGPRLGGAPANFSVMAGRLGNHSAILSRIGRDDLGREAVHRLDPLPADTSFLQIDRSMKPAELRSPSTTVSRSTPFTNRLRGTQWNSQTSGCALRNARMPSALDRSRSAASNRARPSRPLRRRHPSRCIRIFDVNLRPPFYSSEVIQESLELATVMKMNDAEVPLVLALLGIPGEEGATLDNLRLGAERMLAEFPTLQLVAITCGAHGSLLVTREEWHRHPGFPINIADTIGAGDAFTAAIAHYLLRGAELALLNEAGNRWGSWVASQSGAMPSLSEATLAEIDTAIERSA